MPQEACLWNPHTVLTIVLPTLVPCKLESVEIVAIYEPQGVLQLLGYDQDTHISETTSCSSALVIERFFHLGLRHAWIMLPGGVLFWQKSMGVLDLFIGDKEESSLEIDIPTPVKVKDPFLRIQKNVGTW